MRRFVAILLLVCAIVVPQSSLLAVISLQGTPQEYIDRKDELFEAADKALADLLALEGPTALPIQVSYHNQNNNLQMLDEVTENTNYILKQSEEKCVRDSYHVIGWAPNETGKIFPVVIYTYDDCKGLPGVFNRHLWIQLGDELQPIGVLVRENVRVITSSPERGPAQ